jgi:hypothetical protein
MKRHELNVVYLFCCRVSCISCAQGWRTAMAMELCTGKPLSVVKSPATLLCVGIFVMFAFRLWDLFTVLL